MSNTTATAITGQVVTERVAKICAERGHATHTVDGVDTGSCPRCGEVTATEAPADVAKFDRMIRLEGEVRLTAAVAAMAPKFWERDRAAERHAGFKAELDGLFGSLPLSELAAFGEYRSR